MKQIRRSALTATLMSFVTATTTHAGFSQSTLAPPGGFIQAGAYQSTSSGLIPGQDLSTGFGIPNDFHEQAFAGNSAAQASAATSNPPITVSVLASADLGRFRAATNNTHLDSSHFVAGVANGGWKETFTVSHPSFDGQAGFMVFQVRVRGFLSATGITGSASVLTTGYKNNLELQVNSYFSRVNSDPIGTDRQRAQWGLGSSGAEQTRTVDGSVNMSVPITFGQSFTVGFYAMALAGQRSQGSFPNPSSSTLDFSDEGVTWNGIVNVYAAGAPIAGYTIVSGSGIDWSQPFGTCLAAGNGDGNGDGSANGLDTPGMTTLLISGPTPSTGHCAYDMNADGMVNLTDLPLYIARLLN